MSTIGLVAGTIAALAGTGYYLVFRKPLPKKSGEFKIPALSAPVEIFRNRLGIPHIYARTLPDLFFAQGFVHAQDRLWQMDFNRRLVRGRLSEILGEVSVPLDRWMRILGMFRPAEQEYQMISEETRTALRAYADGVNARIRQGSLPVEFTLLRFRPEPWTPQDTLIWTKMMAWTLSVNWEAEILRAQMIQRLGAEKTAELDMHDQALPPYVIPPGVDYDRIGSEALRRAEMARRFMGAGATGGVGSNNWVLSGKRTTTGHPLLANDMHLTLSIPAIWYENHLCAEDLNISGITFAGIPGIIAGHNQQVAWGYTNGFPDVQDLYMEHLRRAEDGSVQYEVKGQWLPAKLIRETIQVKGKPDVVEEVIITRHGPIINKLSPDFTGEQPLALRWTAYEPNNMLDGLGKMLRAGDCYEFEQALRLWSVPSQNTVFADTQGNIAYRLTGKVPTRIKGDGRLPVPGWTDEYEWISYIPFDEMPSAFNPPDGVIITANNRVVDERYPYYLSSDYCRGSRAGRIQQLIDPLQKISPDDIRRMHVDQVSIPARTMAGLLSQVSTDDPELQILLGRLAAWDGSLSADSPLAAFYQSFCVRLLHRLLDPRLGDLAGNYIGKGITPILAEGTILAERAREWLEWVLQQPDSDWFDLGKGEQRDDVLRLVLRETVDDIKEHLGPGIDDWAWGRLHTLTLLHPLGAVKPLDKLFNRGPYPMGGDYDTVWASGSSRFDLSSVAIVGPPFRFIADLGNLDNCLGVLLPGQSGQPSSAHYADQLQTWLKGEYHTMLFSREQVEKEAKSKVVLRG
jgi:penicillin amidase